MTTEEKLKFILGRRSVRIYSPGEISQATVTRLLEAAMAGPSAMTKDPWRFVTVRKPETLCSLAGILPGGKMLETAGVAILICGDLDVAFNRELSFLLQDCSAATENLLLAAHACELGACWVGVHPSEEAVKGVRELFSLPGSFVPVAVVALGHPGEQLEARTRYNPAFVREEIWRR